MIMQNTNRLINDFKDQSADTIWKFMNAMAVNYTVYSTHLKGLSPFLTDNDVYLYCNDTNVVIVCLDRCGNDDEQVYEESLTLSSMLFDDSQEPRVSMVWKLKEAVRLAKIRLQNTTPNVNVYGVLLTEAAILNKYELYRLWDANNVMVIDDLKRLRYKKIKINDDGELACKAYVSGVIDATLNQDDNDVSGYKPNGNDGDNSGLSDRDFAYDPNTRSLVIVRPYNELKDKNLAFRPTYSPSPESVRSNEKLPRTGDVNPGIFITVSALLTACAAFGVRYLIKRR